MADEDLVEAERLLAKYAEENECGWCRKKARTIREAASELRRASPKAMDLTEKFKEELHSSNLDNIEAEVEDLRRQADKSQSFRERLDQILSTTEASRPRERIRESGPLPQLPPIVTADEVGRREADRRRQFMDETEYRAGPVRTAFRFRLWKRWKNVEDRDGPLSRRSQVGR